jgi:hypothetical protein
LLGQEAHRHPHGDAVGDSGMLEQGLHDTL